MMGKRSKKPNKIFRVGEIEKFIITVNFVEDTISIPRFLDKEYYPDEVKKYMANKKFTVQFSIF